MAFDPFQYGTDYMIPKEPPDGASINYTKYVKHIPLEFQTDMNALGVMAYYYSVPYRQFAQWIDYVVRQLYERKEGVDGWKSSWAHTQEVTNTPTYLYTVKIFSNNRQVAYLSCFQHEVFRTGTVIILAANALETVKYEEFLRELVKTALVYWAQVRR